MAVPNFKIMRGLPIPDSNFGWPTADSWALTGITSDDISFMGPRPTGGVGDTGVGRGAHLWGTGRAMVITPDSGYPSSPGTSHYIESAYTPYGIGATPFTPAGGVEVWVGVVCKTVGMAANTYPLLGAVLQGYDASGVGTGAIDFSGASNYPKNAAGNDLMIEETDFALYSNTSSSSSLGSTTAWYKLQLQFAEPSTTAGAAKKIIVSHVIVAFPFDQTVGYDQIDNWYMAESPHGSATEMRWQTSKFRERPRAQVLNRQQHRFTQSFSFPNLDDDDKRLLQACYMWNRGTPTDDVSFTGTSYIVNRGQSLPVVVVANRDETKLAFYADFANDLTFSPAPIGWWPESGTRWTTTCTFEERL